MPPERMNVPTSFRSFLGNHHAIDILERAIERDRLPHALIFAGPPGIGKCTLAILLAQRLNCSSPTHEGACGRCRTCRKILAVLQARYAECRSAKGGMPCGGCESCRVIADQHPDVRLIQPEPDKTTISIEQVRDLITEIAYQPFEALIRVAIFDPAEQMRESAHNSLLKTLEEPASRTVMILVTATPSVLPQTIHSRSRMLRFGGIPENRIVKYLIDERAVPPEEARLAAVFSHGSLASAICFETEQYRGAREKALRFASLLLERGGFSDASNLVAGVSKDKRTFDIWLESLEAVLQDIYFSKMAPDRMRQQDLRNEISRLAKSATRADVVSALEAIKVLRRALLRNVQRQIAMESIYLSLASR